MAGGRHRLAFPFPFPLPPPLLLLLSAPSSSWEKDAEEDVEEEEALEEVEAVVCVFVGGEGSQSGGWGAYLRIYNITMHEIETEDAPVEPLPPAHCWCGEQGGCGKKVSSVVRWANRACQAACCRSGLHFHVHTRCPTIELTPPPAPVPAQSPQPPQPLPSANTQ